MSYVDINVHAVWGTKNRTPFLTKNIRNQLFLHIRTYASNHDIYIDHINGFEDHVHCLINLKYNQNISFVVKLIKGESSKWLNSSIIESGNFQWAKGYYAASISSKDIPVVRKYIRNQEKHHEQQSFEKEIESMFNRINQGEFS